MAVMSDSREMPESLRQKARPGRWLTGLGLGFFAAVVTGLLWWGGLFVQARLQLEDVFVVPRATSEEVVIVAIDDASLAAYGRFSEWSRELYADLLDLVSDGGGRVVALDILLAGAAPDDTQLAEAITRARQSEARTRTVIAGLGTQRDTVVNDIVSYQTLVAPMADFLDAGAMMGSVNVLPDVDGRVRYVPMLLAVEDQVGPSLSLAAFLSHRGISATLMDQVVDYEVGTLTLPGDQIMPTDLLGRLRVNYFSVPGHSMFPTYSLHEVLSGSVDPAVFAGKIVLVGLMDQTALTDSYPVPGSRDGTLMAGVEIHANALETLMQGASLTVQGTVSQLVTLVLLALFGGVVFYVVPWRWLLPLLMVALVGWVLTVIVYYNLRGVIVNLFHTGLALLLTGLVVGIFRVVEEVIRRQRTEILLASALSAIEHNSSVQGVLGALGDDLDRILEKKGARGWLWDDRRRELVLAHPELPAGEALPLELRPWLSLAQSALNERVVTVQRGWVAVPLLWQDRQVGVLTGQAQGRVGPFRRDLLQRLSWQTAELVVNAQLYEETQRLSEFKTRIIRMASHDLKNPLTRIMGYAELLQGRAEDEDADELTLTFLDHIVRAGDEMNGIILDLLDLEFARQGMRSAAEYDLLQVMDDVIMRFEGDIAQKQQTLRIEMPDTLPRLFGDMTQVRQSISNLVSNASKYTPEAGTITLQVEDRQDSARVTIRDTGYGIPGDELPNLFQEFYRVKTDETLNISGTGLGLSLVKAVIEAHGGSVWAESVYGEGSTFFVELPYELPEALRPNPKDAA